MVALAATASPAGRIVRLYRVMCEAEFQSLMRKRRFSTVPGSVEGKWLAETVEHAAAWGRWFERIDDIPHRRIVEVELPEQLVGEMIRYPRLDSVGPAVFATLRQLRGVKFREVVHE